MEQMLEIFVRSSEKSTIVGSPKKELVGDKLENLTPLKKNWKRDFLIISR